MQGGKAFRSVFEASTQAGRARRGLTGLFIFTAILLAPALVAVFVPGAPLEDRFQDCAYSIVLWAFWLAVWGRGYRACLAATPFLLVVPTAIFLMISYRSQLTPAFIGIIAETNLEESSQFLAGFWLPVAAAYGSIFAMAWIALRLLRRNDIAWRHRSRFWVLILVPSAWSGLWFAYAQQEVVARDLKPPADPFRVEPMPLAVEYLRNTAPFGLVLQVETYCEARLKILQTRQLLAGFRFGARQAIHTADRQVYVLVIGESARRDRWSLYGYGRSTSPQLQHEPNLIAFDNVVTIATATRISVPVILTRRLASGAMMPAFWERSVVSAFHEAGFSTYWLSTQAPVGVYDAPLGALARDADHTAYYNHTGGWAMTPPDGVMIEPLRRALADRDATREFIVIHTLGSHFDYRYRYPPEFDVFKPSPAKGDTLSLHDAFHDPATEQKLSNAYDNSILYTDHFLRQVLDAVRESGRPLAAVIYLSDHGEDLYDQSCSNTGHGRATPPSYRIPFLFWYSSAYEQAFPEKVALLKQHRELPLTSETVFPTLLDVAQIHFPSEDLTRSAASATLELRPRLVTSTNGLLDFDRAHLNSHCELEN
jgi:glucan phosphoethanolaminetransferase (alkaline phosphatase superfamily)